MLKSKFENFLNFIKNKNIIITTHDLVDIDGLVSCIILKFFLNQYLKNQNVFIYFSDFTKSTKNFIKNFAEKFTEFDLSYEKNIILSNTDVLLIVDTNNLNQVRFDYNFDISDSGVPYIFIDHHYRGANSKNSNRIAVDLIDEKYSSTAELILELIEFYNIPLNIPLKNLIISAILTDSGFFKHGNNKTIQNVSKLLCEDINIQDILLLLKREIDISEKIAQIKGLQRVELIQEGNYLIGITNVSSFGASVASMLTKMGFDIGIVISKEPNHYKINTRAKKRVCRETGLNLGKILEEISKEYEGSGGGHDGAASLTINIEFDVNTHEIIDKIKQYL
ncbi:MAG: bifunctional oligoribonuclease/PAP phosphatase NrnA [Promethearchaeota archaeon]